MSQPCVGMCRGCRKVVKSGWQVVRPWMGSFHNSYPWLTLNGVLNSRLCRTTKDTVSRSLRFPRMFRGVGRQCVADVSGEPAGPTWNRQAVTKVSNQLPTYAAQHRGSEKASNATRQKHEKWQLSFLSTSVRNVLQDQFYGAYSAVYYSVINSVTAHEFTKQVSKYRQPRS